MAEQWAHWSGTKGYSGWGDIKLGTCHLWGPAIFSIFITDLDLQLEGILNKFANDRELGGAGVSLESKEAR